MIRARTLAVIAVTVLFVSLARAETDRKISVPKTTKLRPSSPLQGRTIVIDPGHGAINFQGEPINLGKVNRQGVPEHRLNFEIACKLGALLEKEGAHVYYTRTAADYWRQAYDAAEDNKMRALFANEIKAEALIAIHCDWSPSRKSHGVTTLYEKPNSEALSRAIQQMMVKDLKAHNRNVVHESFTVLDNALMPAVIVETGFMSHRKESKLLMSSSHQTQVAKAIADGLRRYFQRG